MAITKLAKADIDGDIVDYSGKKLATKQSVTDLGTTVATKADASALNAKADVSALNAKADNSAVVHTTGTETIAGAKTFSSPVTVGAPTAVGHAVTKGYADALSGPSGGVVYQLATDAARRTVPTGFLLLIVGGSAPPSWMLAGDVQLATA